MGKGATFENQLLKLIFQATGIANVADNAGSSPLTNLYVSLHTADPTSAGNQSSSEVSYTGYSRVAVARSNSGWTVTTNSVSPAATIQFTACPSGTSVQSATYAAIGTASSGAGEILYSGALSPAIPIQAGVTPQIAAGSTITET